MTAREKIINKLKDKYTLIENDENVRVWVCKERKINYDLLYDAIINIHKNMSENY
jgi:hypothetical protein